MRAMTGTTRSGSTGGRDGARRGLTAAAALALAVAVLTGCVPGAGPDDDARSPEGGRVGEVESTTEPRTARSEEPAEEPSRAASGRAGGSVADVPDDDALVVEPLTGFAGGTTETFGAFTIGVPKGWAVDDQQLPDDARAISVMPSDGSPGVVVVYAKSPVGSGMPNLMLAQAMKGMEESWEGVTDVVDSSVSWPGHPHALSRSLSFTEETTGEIFDAVVVATIDEDGEQLAVATLLGLEGTLEGSKGYDVLRTLRFR